MVALTRTASELVLTIRDTGKGFDQDAHDKAPAGFGRIIMRERMRGIGGRFAIESHPGQGTTVTAALSMPGSAWPSVWIAEGREQFLSADVARPAP